jgi:hypothetical protein
LHRRAAATRVGLLQTPRQIAADLFDYVLLVVKKIRKRLQQRFKAQRIYIELVNAVFLKAGGTAEQFRDGYPERGRQRLDGAARSPDLREIHP